MYTKTTYVSGGAPGISATRLNNNEQGTYDAQLYGSDVGGDDTYVLDLSTTLVAGMIVSIKVTTGNTNSCSLSINNGANSYAIKKITNSGLVDLETGDIAASATFTVIFDGTYFIGIGLGIGSHVANTTTAHGAVSEATASKIIIRDAAGRAKVVAPSAEDDIALKSNVTTVAGDLVTHTANTTTAHGAVSAATASKIIIRDAAGRAKVVAPSATDDIALKSTVTADIATHAALTTAGTHGAVSAATASKIIIRDVAGRAKVVAPSAEDDIALKSNVTTVAGDLVTHTANTTTAHGAVSAATASKIIIRDAAGRAKVVAPSATDDIALKSTVTADIATHAALTTAGTHGAVSAATASKIIIRDAAGRAKVSAPSASDDIARKDTVDAVAVLVGTVIWYAKNTAPTGYLKCNGAAISRATYAALFAIINTTFGIGNGSTTFNVPDLRAEFIRGWDDSREIDTARVFGSSQDGTIIMSNTTTPGQGTLCNASNLDETSALANGDRSSASTSSSSRSQFKVRPRNVALLACIKY